MVFWGELDRRQWHQGQQAACSHADTLIRKENASTLPHVSLTLHPGAGNMLSFSHWQGQWCFFLWLWNRECCIHHSYFLITAIPNCVVRYLSLGKEVLSHLSCCLPRSEQSRTRTPILCFLLGQHAQGSCGLHSQALLWCEWSKQMGARHQETTDPLSPRSVPVRAPTVMGSSTLQVLVSEATSCSFQWLSILMLYYTSARGAYGTSCGSVMRHGCHHQHWTSPACGQETELGISTRSAESTWWFWLGFFWMNIPKD